jgi:Carbohydrate-selective porin, OprB family
MIGVEPYLGSVRADVLGLSNQGLRYLGLRNDTSLHVEGFYKFQITDNISITPGFVWITAPDQDRENNSYAIGTIRTTFSF